MTDTHVKNRPLRVLLLLDRFGIGGTETQMNLLVRRSEDPGVIFLILALGGTLAENSLFPPKAVVGVVGRRSRFDLFVISRLRSMVRSQGVDVVFAPHRFSGLLAKLCRLLPGFPPVVVALRGRRQLNPWRKFLYDGLDEWLMPLASEVLSNAPTEVARLRRHQYLRDKVTLVENAVDLNALRGDLDPGKLRDEWDIREGTFVVGSVGRLVPIKDYPTALRAMASLSAREHSVHWVIVGDGPERRRLDDLIDSLSMRENVTLLGRDPRAAALIAAFDVLLHPSLWENSANAILEAMAQGVPVVACRVGGNAHLLEDPRCGILTPPSDSDGMAQALEELMFSGKLRTELGEQGKSLVRARHSPTAFVHDHLTVLRRAAGFVAEEEHAW